MLASCLAEGAPSVPLGPFCELDARQPGVRAETGAAYPQGSGTSSALLVPGRDGAPPLAAPKEVWLLRHGQSAWNFESRIQGDTNESGLTERGVAQAVRMGEALARVEFDGGCFSSPVKRAAQTADIVWREHQASANEPEAPIHLPELKEMNLLHLQGMKNSDAAVRYPDSYRIWRNTPHNFRGLEPGEEAPANGGGTAPPPAQTYPVRDLWTRAHTAWGHILNAPGKRALVISHKSTLRGMVCVALGLPPESFRAVDLHNGGLSIIRVDEFGVPMISALNTTTHMVEGYSYTADDVL